MYKANLYAINALKISVAKCFLFAKEYINGYNNRYEHTVINASNLLNAFLKGKI